MAAISVRKKVVKRVGHAPDTKFVLLRVAGNGRPHTWELSRKALRALADQIKDALDNEEDHRTNDGNNRSQ